MPVTDAPTGRARRPVRKSERLETRATPELKRLAQRAAEIEGRSLTDFVAASVQERAERRIQEYEMTTVSGRYGRSFAEAIVNSPPPNARLREAAAFFDVVMGAE